MFENVYISNFHPISPVSTSKGVLVYMLSKEISYYLVSIFKTNCCAGRNGYGFKGRFPINKVSVKDINIIKDIRFQKKKHESHQSCS